VFETLRYEVRDRQAYLTLNRPERLNVKMPGEIHARHHRVGRGPGILRRLQSQTVRRGRPGQLVS
jgi:enoyl-CoA hydratase/carnithine racemase